MKWTRFGFGSFAALGLLGASASVSAQLRTQLYVSGLSLPVAMVQDPTNPNVQFVVQQRGRIRIILNGVLQANDFLDLTGVVSTSGSERGLLGLAFHPAYAQNRYFYLNYTDLPSPGNTRIARYQRNSVNPLLADPGSAFPILTIAQPFTNHNGGTLRFGPMDSDLYIGMGDGGSGNDPGNRAQTMTGMLLGKMLRIDIDGDDFPADPSRNYRIPPTNPFAGPTVGDDEIWSCGIRNPWKFTFDDPAHLGTGGMLIGDVGQVSWEEWDYEPPLAGGRNYGWREREGYVTTGLGGWNGIPMSDPKWVYPRGAGAAITGGYVYRGTMLGDFFGRYFFAEYIQNRIWSAKLTINSMTQEAANALPADVSEHTADLAIPGGNISSIDVDSNGELYYVHLGGSIYRILPENRAWPIDIAPRHGDEIVSGGVRHLLAVDSKELVTQYTIIVETAIENENSAVVGFMTDMAAPSFLDVRTVCRVNDGTGPSFLRLHLKNWATGIFVQVGEQGVGTSLTTLDFNSIPAASYRRADGRIELLVTAYKPSALAVDPFLCLYDQIRVVTR